MNPEIPLTETAAEGAKAQWRHKECGTLLQSDLHDWSGTTGSVEIITAFSCLNENGDVIGDQIQAITYRIYCPKCNKCFNIGYYADLQHISQIAELVEEQ